MDDKFLTVDLTDEEMAALDDGQEWWQDGDNVSLSGYEDGAIELTVNGESACENFMHSWDDVPTAIRNRAA